MALMWLRHLSCLRGAVCCLIWKPCKKIHLYLYNFVLNEATNNNDVKCIVNIVSNEVPNSNNATHIGNNVRLTAVGTQQFSIAAI